MSERRRRRAARGWRIASQLRILVFVCWAMLLTASVTAAGSLFIQSENVRQLTQVDDPAVAANNEVRQAMTDAQTGLDGYQLSGDRALLQTYFGAHDRTMTALATLQDTLGVAAVDRADAARHKDLQARQRLTAQRWWAHALLTEQTLSSGGQADAFQGRALFESFRTANAAVREYLAAERDQTRSQARNISRGVVASVAATFAALLAMLVLGGLVARTISRPLTELRDTMRRQRNGELHARAREDQGSLELRSVAGDFNALTDQNLALRQTQARALGTHQITLDIARAIRTASDTQQALDVMCVALAEGLDADRVVANTIGVNPEVRLGAQWHRPNLPPLGDLTLLPELGGLAEELWLSAGFRARNDVLEAETQPQELGPTFYSEIGARAIIMVPIGLHDRVIGMIYVFMVSEPRAWTTAETNVVQAVAGFVARATVEAEHQANQREHVERIERLDRQKSDFLATVSHELRTPLTSISGYVELLQDGDDSELSAQQRRMLEVISRNTVRLRGLIEDVMVLSRIEGGVSKAGFVEVSVGALITRVGEELSPLARDKAIELEVDVGPQAAVVVGDSASLERAVVNILSNAIKFSRPGGVVTITGSLDREARRVLITCQDFGFGIPVKDQADLFTRFFRASNATDQAIPGTGLGLSIAKQIVEDHHGGALRLISVEDEGTTVIIDLPWYELSGEHLDERFQTEKAVGNDSRSDDVFGIRA